jgi:CRP-like cAMP-binding protein
VLKEDQQASLFRTSLASPGGIVGELSTIDGLPRSASVAAIQSYATAR